jgi:hypothetical protein
MRYFLLLFFNLLYLVTNAQKSGRMPAYMAGSFSDDYEISYKIEPAKWVQLPNAVYHIIKVNSIGQFIIAKNDRGNKSDSGLYSRIDFVKLKKMEPYSWAFCLSEYKALSDTAAENGYKADRNNLMKGCNGFPFSRMKRVLKNELKNKSYE